MGEKATDLYKVYCRELDWKKPKMGSLVDRKVPGWLGRVEGKRKRVGR